MDCPPPCVGFKQELHPEFCTACGVPGSSKVFRLVGQTRFDPEGRCVDEVVRRLLLQCRTRTCPRWKKCWTVYEEGGYPRRRHTLALIVAVASELALVLEATFTDLAARLGCHRTTIGRWVTWMMDLGGVEELTRICALKDPDGLPPPPPPAPSPPSPRARRVPAEALSGRRIAGHVLRLLECLADIYRRWEMPLEDGPGLVVLLRRQFLVRREIVWLMHPSTLLHVDWGRVGP